MSDPWAPPSKHFVLCYYCQKSTNATEIGIVTADPDPFSAAPEHVILVCCDVCGHGLVFGQEHQFGGVPTELYRLWPGRTRLLSEAVPEPLRDEHAEARKCFEVKAYTAAVVMVGRTLEGVCALNGVRGQSLVQSLRKMKDQKLIDERLFDWAEGLRVLRNEGAHYTGSRVSRVDAADALALCEALLDNMYVLSAKFKEFQRRRAKLVEPATADVAEAASDEED